MQLHLRRARAGCREAVTHGATPRTLDPGTHGRQAGRRELVAANMCMGGVVTTARGLQDHGKSPTLCAIPPRFRFRNQGCKCVHVVPWRADFRTELAGLCYPHFRFRNQGGR